MDITLFDADTIADGIIHEMNRRGKSIDNLKINKLLFFTEGVHYLLTKHPLIKEEFEAWIHGPVVPALYRRFKQFGWREFGPEVTKGSGPMDEDAREAILQVVEELGDLSGPELERRSHEISSYIKARAGVPIDEPSNAIISKSETFQYFEQLFD